jgi:antagonist of KipI
MALRLLRPGLLTTVQDLGRPGWQHLGVAPGGAMDPASHRLANALVGNEAGAATLELALVGPDLLFESGALVALHGAPFAARVDGVPMPWARPVLVRPGARLQLGAAAGGCYGYLAVAGGIDVPRVLGGRGTCLAGGFGGLGGTPLVAGAVVPLTPDAGELSRARFARLAAERAPLDVGPAARTVRWFVPSFTLPEPGPSSIRVLAGLHAPLFSQVARDALCNATWQVTAGSDRMGMRLAGPVLPLQAAAEVVTQAATRGTVQVPAGGQPIVLLADHQATGGYPKLAEVIAADTARIAQLPPGASLRFVTVDLAAADLAREDLERRVAQLVRRLAWEFGH